MRTIVCEARQRGFHPRGSAPGALRRDLVSMDGLRHIVQAGGTVILHPGQSITIPQYCYHSFWADDSPTLVGEVSMVNDDNLDNRFYEEMDRFTQVEEDELSFRLLVSAYAGLGESFS